MLNLKCWNNSVTKHGWVICIVQLNISWKYTQQYGVLMNFQCCMPDVRYWMSVLISLHWCKTGRPVLLMYMVARQITSFHTRKLPVCKKTVGHVSCQVESWFRSNPQSYQWFSPFSMVLTITCWISGHKLMFHLHISDWGQFWFATDFTVVKPTKLHVCGVLLSLWLGNTSVTCRIAAKFDLKITVNPC
jgi:hypothetical protein